MIVIELKKFADDAIETIVVDTIEEMVGEIEFHKTKEDMVLIRASILARDYAADAILSECQKLTSA